MLGVVEVEPLETLIVPGLNGSGAGHWQSLLADHLPHARMLSQENWECPVITDWLASIEQELERQSQGVWIVAHSLGCLLTANLAERTAARRIKGALLVAPCHLENVERLHPCIVNFGAMPEKRLPFPSLVVGSRNDPYMSFDGARDWASRWGSGFVDAGYAGHINIASGHGPWPEGERLFQQFRAHHSADQYAGTAAPSKTRQSA
jgi:predicted alpha/beta hydrolase family esterase